MINITLQQAESYFAQRLYATDWTTASSIDRQKALDWSSRIVEAAFIPGTHAVTYDSNNTEIAAPAFIAAVCEQAIHLLRHDPTALPEPLVKGIVSASTAGSSVTFARETAMPLLCSLSRKLLDTIGTCRSEELPGTIESTTLEH